MIKVGILGASGYTGAELLRLLAVHGGVKVVLASRQEAGGTIRSLFPSLAKYFDLELIAHDPKRMGKECDVVFCCMPHKAGMEMTPTLIESGAKVVDLSADFRFNKIETYEKWYGVKHSAAKLAAEAAYGLPELYREKIKPARLVANPGCYPTGAICALVPLLKNKLVDPQTIVVDSKSGVSGAGAKPNETTHYIEANEGIRAYGAPTHRHTPEIEDHLSRAAGKDIVVSFTPHLTPMDRGILTTAYAKLDKTISSGALLDMYREFYKNEKFIRILPEGELPRTKWVRASNYVDIGAFADPRTGRVVVVSAIDNLTKGSSGAAVQNMNIMFGVEESLGLEAAPVFP